MNVSEKTDQAAKSIEDLGYAVIKDVFSDNLTSKFLNKLEDIPKKRIGYGGVNICHTKFLHTSESFMNILSKDEIFMLSQRICGDRCRLDHAFYHDCKKNEGLKKGMDLELLKRLRDIVSIPIIFSGGVGQVEHIIDVVPNTDAVALASVLHYNEYSIKFLKDILYKKGINVRS